jgi:hypothetical protein
VESVDNPKVSLLTLDLMGQDGKPFARAAAMLEVWQDDGKRQARGTVWVRRGETATAHAAAGTRLKFRTSEGREGELVLRDPIDTTFGFGVPSRPAHVEVVGEPPI